MTPPTPLMLSSYPRAIVHVDGDAFFTSVEQAVHPALRGKPVVTGKERGIIACASDFRKPAGITPVAGKHIHIFLQRVPLADVWGLGPNRVELLQRYGIKTAWDYVCRDPQWIRRLLHKPGLEIWHELRGTAILKVSTEVWRPVASVSKSKTFSEPSTDRDIVYARLIRNLESAFIKLRRHQLRTGEISVSLRLKDYGESGLSVKLNRSVCTAQEVTSIVSTLFGQLHRPGEPCRSTSVVLGRIEDDRIRQYDLFDDPVGVERCRKLGGLIEKINGRYGKHRIFLGTGLHLAGVEQNDRDEPCWRRVNLLAGESQRRRIRVPMLDMRV